MPDLNRRQALTLAALGSFASALPHWANAAAVQDASAASWDLSEIYPSIQAWDSARTATLEALKGLAHYRGHLGDNADTLARAMVASSDLGRTVVRIYTYASLKGDEDVQIATNQERLGQALSLYSAFGEATAWMSPELIAIGKDKITGFVAASETLKTRFDFSIAETFREAEHILSAEGEALMAMAGEPLQAASDTAGQLRSSDVPWPTVTLSDGTEVRLDSQGYTASRDSANRDDRKKVFDAFFGELQAFKGSFGATYAGQIKADIFNSKARHYPSSLASALSGNDVPDSVYRTLVAETDKGLPQLHRYFELRRRMLKLPDLHYYDIYPPLVALDRTFTLAEMRTTTIEAVKPLGADYGMRIARATAEKWMDPFPRKGKRPGAYMNPSAYDVHPYLLLNLTEDYDGMSTYAHEWGHALHSLLANASQPYDKADYPIFLAEIPSTLNEQLLVQHMLKGAKTKEEKLFYLGQQMERLRGTFYRQTMFAEFELKAHDAAEAGEGLSGEKFNAIYLDLLKRYHGPKVEIDPVYASEWAFIPHFYNAFYVYQYATCIAAASFFAQQILNGGPKERDNYLSVLKAGGSDHPTEILKRAGLDMTTPAPYQALVATMKDTIDQAETLLG